MAAPNRRSLSGVDRRASMRTSVRSSMQNDDENEFALAAMGISDGFRPSDSAAAPQRSNTELPAPRPSSISKAKGLDSFALRHDGQMGPIAERSTGAPASSSSNQPDLVHSDAPFVRPESPYRGPTGPSHQYQMYSQESRSARTASVATSVGPGPIVERNYTGPSGPTHPYGMYPQNTVVEAESSTTQQAAPITVGFPGLNNQQYQRRLGPDGEELAGMIGPDGHTEELPPYTQYPEEAFARKTLPTINPNIPGAGGMGLATRNPEFASREDLQSRQSTRSFQSDTSEHLVNVAAAGATSEKPELKPWQKALSRKLCGIVPIWVLVLFALLLILFGIILGSVLVALKPKDKPHRSNGTHDDGNDASAMTMTTTFDATPLSTVPAGLPTLPTGTFALPIQMPSFAESSCLDDSSQSAAWSCNLPPSPLQMVVDDIPGTYAVSSKEVAINLGNNSMPVFPYGAQPPTLSSTQVLNLVIDSQDVSKGPAWFFQMPYNKLVVLPEGSLSATASNTKRQLNIGDFTRKGVVAQPGDKPWFCYWNGTLLEAFIYPNVTSSSGNMVSASSSRMSPTSTLAQPSATASGPSSTMPQGNPVFLAGYPKVVKVEERRIPSGPQTISPYCIQQVIDSNGYPSPYVNSTGQQIRIFLNETEPTQVSPLSDKRSIFSVNEQGYRIVERQSDSTCGCVWMAA